MNFTSEELLKQIKSLRTEIDETWLYGDSYENSGAHAILDDFEKWIKEQDEKPIKGKPQDTDPHAPHYFAPYDDMGNKRTINNAVDAGWSATEGKNREELGSEIGIDVAKWDAIHK